MNSFGVVDEAGPLGILCRSPNKIKMAVWFNQDSLDANARIR
jgi:hypothetical protein